MATPEQLIQQVRFGLETLRERNGHHEFEALCLAVARRRIASNLLPCACREIRPCRSVGVGG
jgi:hypothetical protein